MRTYDKRIGFLVSSQTLIPHGGIGQFTKSFCELMDSHNIKVDIITDKQPQNTAFINSLNVKIIAPTTVLKYTDHSAIFMYGDTFCYERMANFRTAIVEALEENMYDAFVCNTYETVQLASTMGLEDIIQIIAYTHLESQIFTNTNNPFLISTNEMMRKQLEMNALWIGTQSKFNQLQLQNAYELPIPLPEKDLLKEHHKPREGVLFIGRWEGGKNPELYLDLIEQTRLPAKVMTSATGAKKFEARLKEIGVPYEIKIGIIGQEKVDFITSARVAFNPSLVESYGIAFLEQMTQMPTVALDNMRWTNNFNSQHFFTCTKQTMVSIVNNLYNTYTTAQSWYDTGALKHTQTMDNAVFHKWNDCFNQFTCKQSKSNTALICKTLTPPNLTIKYADFIVGLQRRIICMDDARSIFTNKHKYRVIYTDDDTYLTLDPAFVPSLIATQSNTPPDVTVNPLNDLFDFGPIATQSNISSAVTGNPTNNMFKFKKIMMREKIINCINSAEFQELLGLPISYTLLDYEMLEVKKTSTIKHKGGLYFLYDDNSHGKYNASALWYLGKSGNTKTETMRDRIIKHRRHALSLKSKSGNNINWSQFNTWLAQRGHDGQHGVYDTNSKVLWLDLDDKELSSEQLLLLETHCINVLNPIVNDTFDWSQANQL